MLIAVLWCGAGCGCFFSKTADRRAFFEYFKSTLRVFVLFDDLGLTLGGARKVVWCLECVMFVDLGKINCFLVKLEFVC